MSQSKTKERWACLQCNRSYSRKHDLERHADIAHTMTEDKPFRCVQCNYVFDSEENLRAHENEHEKEETKFRCEICDRGFKSRNIWRRHMRAHIDPSPYACEVCKRRFGREHDMLRHTLRMHSGERKYLCDLCPSKFAWFSDLTIHKGRHNAMGCKKGKKLSSTCSRKTIPKKSGKKKPEKSIEKSPSKDPYVCKICNQSFTTFSVQQLHTCDIAVSSGEEDAVVDLNENNFRRAAAIGPHSYHSKLYPENSESEAGDSNMLLEMNDVDEAHSSHDDVDECSGSLVAGKKSEESVHICETGDGRDLETKDIMNEKYGDTQILSSFKQQVDFMESDDLQTDDILTVKVPKFQKTLIKSQCFKAVTVEGENENLPESSNLDEDVPVDDADKAPLGNSNIRNSAMINKSVEELQTGPKHSPNLVGPLYEQTHDVDAEGAVDSYLREKEHAGNEIGQPSNSENTNANIDKIAGELTNGLKCKLCLKVFPKFSSLQLHLCGENLEVNITEKSPRDTTTKVLSKSKDPNIQKTSSKSPAESGGNSVISKISMKTQQQTSTDPDSFTCGDCRQMFSKISKLKRHSIEKHNKLLMLSCSICQKEFRTKSKLERHFAIHENSVTHSCEDCGKPFKYKRDMLRHKEQHSDQKAKLKCNFCSREFFRKHDLDKHVENIHPAKAPYRCELCLAGFISAEQLEKHLPEHALTHPHLCWECKRGFRTLQNLKRHLVLHSDERPFSCPVCKRGFYRKYDMFQHMRIHRSERIACELCDRKFVSGDGLKKHFKKKHSSSS